LLVGKLHFTTWRKDLIWGGVELSHLYSIKNFFFLPKSFWGSEPEGWGERGVGGEGRELTLGIFL